MSVDINTDSAQMHGHVVVKDRPAKAARPRMLRPHKAPKPAKAPRITNASKARAAYMSPTGATMEEILALTGDTQYVVLQTFRNQEDKYKVEAVDETNAKGKRVKRYFVLPLSLEAKISAV